jgi:hypothetical protein
MVMVPLALAANLSTEVVVKTTLVDRLMCLRSLIRMGELVKPHAITGGKHLFEYLEKNNVKSMYRSQARNFFFYLRQGTGWGAMVFTSKHGRWALAGKYQTSL